MKHSIKLAAAGAGVAILFSGITAPAAFAAPDEVGGSTRHDESQAEQLLLDSIQTGPAKNVILLIGDGMGDSEITIARNYQYGAGGELPGIDALPLTGQYTTYSLYRDGTPNAGKADYVPDSAATGTGWATGTKTFDNAVGVDIRNAARDNIVEIAKANGMRTGNVTTSEIQDATPAVMGAHVAARSCYGPDSTSCGSDALEAGGLGSISEQLLDTRADLTMGGGAASFAQLAKAGPWQGDSLLDQAADRGFQVVDDAAGLAAVTTASQDQPVLGLFADGNFPTRFASTTATVGGADTPTTCSPNPDALSSDLNLANLTTKAIDLLDDPASENGFFLQVEGASIDKRDHGADACGQIGETLDLDEAVQAALDFAQADGETLVIVTADHSHTSQIVDSTPPGLSTALTTVGDGTVMKISYGTAAPGGSQQHTGSQLRIAGYGPGAANIVGLTDQTDNFFTITGALELNRDVAALSAAASGTLVGNSGDSSPTVLAPGEAFEIDAAGFAGDRQLSPTTSTGGTVAPAKADLIYGTTTLTGTAPTTPGDYTVTLTPNRTGKVITVAYSVTADGAPVSGGTIPTGNGSPTGSGSPASDIASTGLAALPYLAIALVLMAAGAAAVIVRRRQHA
ncbi:alkaline phosphatase [Herbiconiux sp. L3-i23]|uniref:alkaline phosphatase n=1 Tax=Herbiconiux sp. L3-i23 TaxID=2905871 RepID=UPI002049CBD6|nr:alkaline phosphatase [Herbiconiux sp. L3-i23]BDI23809.1 hypothetical protein L3i23_25850 [Herbiconiux sp. L3-i23]